VRIVVEGAVRRKAQRLRRSNLRPLLKGETLKKWLGDIFENRPGTHFQIKIKTVSRPVAQKWENDVLRLSNIEYQG
jgi:hypothetical protein